jgi:hypothetical protein
VENRQQLNEKNTRGNFTLVKEEGRWKVLLDPENNIQ